MENTTKKKSKKLWIILAAVFVLLAAGAGAVLYFVVLNPKVETITVTPAAVELKIGENSQATYVITPEKAGDAVVTWTSSDPNVATVDGKGLISGCGEGNCIITANAEGKTAVLMANVLPNVDQLTLSVTEADLFVGENIKADYTILPEGANYAEVTWTSSDETVATVDELGNVIAVGAGTCEITATAQEKTANITVTSTPKVENLAFSTPLLDVFIGDSKVIHCTVSPAEATRSEIKWTSSDPSVATVSQSGLVNAKKEGTCVITAEADGVKTTATVTVEREGKTEEAEVVGTWYMSYTTDYRGVKVYFNKGEGYIYLYGDNTGKVSITGVKYSINWKYSSTVNGEYIFTTDLGNLRYNIKNKTLTLDFLYETYFKRS